MHPDPLRSKRLSLRWPLGSSIGIALLLMLGVAGVCEGLASVKWIQRRLPPPSVGCGHPQLDRKLALLNTLMARKGGVDCLFVGSSMVLRSFNPEVFGESYKQQTGKEITSFNFGLGGLAEPGEELLNRILVEKYRPRLLIIGTSPYGLDEVKGAEFLARLKTNPWVLYHQGKISLDGWLIEHSLAFRNYLGYRFLSEDNPLIIKEIRQSMVRTTDLGFGNREVWRFNRMNDNAIAILGRYEISEEHLTALSHVLQLHSAVPMLMVEIPIAPDLLGSFRNGEQDYYRALDAIRDVAAAQGVPFWRMPSDRAIQLADFQDGVHMNRIGADRFSRWLGEQMGLAVRQGQLKDPTK